MDQVQTGLLLRALRKEKSLTQQQLADALGVQAKTVSKWECGRGCPDLATLPMLARLLDVSAVALLKGDLDTHPKETGIMKNTKFYRCPDCGSIVTTTGNASVTCCGRTLTALEVQKADDCHGASVEDMDGEWYVSFPHEMTKEHFITFAAVLGYDRVLVVRLYPEQSGEVRLPRLPGGKIFLCCSRDGLFRIK